MFKSRQPFDDQEPVPVRPIKQHLEDLLEVDFPEICTPVMADIVLAKCIAGLEKRVRDLEMAMARKEDL